MRSRNGGDTDNTVGSLARSHFVVPVLFLLISVPASSGGEIRGGFATIAEGLTAVSLQEPIVAHERMFTLSILSEACQGKSVSKLVTIQSAVVLTARKEFPLSV